MSDIDMRLRAWGRYQAAQDQERERRAFLLKPPAKNPDHLTLPVRIKRIGSRGFWANGKMIALGEVCTVDAVTAQDLVAMGKAEFVGRSV